MKIENRMLISKEDIQKIKDANESVKGTLDYTKYLMEEEYRYYNEEKEKWGRWKYIAWSYPIRYNPGWANSGYYIEIYRGHVFIKSLAYTEFGRKCVDRYRVTDRIMELLDWQI